jgi:hypothetical protein
VSVSQSSTQPGTSGQIAYYPGAGTAIAGISAVPVAAGGTGAGTAASALQNLGGVSATATTQQTIAGSLSVAGSVAAPSVTASVNSQLNVMAAPFNAKGDCVTDDSGAIQAALNVQKTTSTQITVYFPAPPGGCYLTSTLTFTGASMQGQAGAGFVGVVSKGGIVLKGKPGQDVLHEPDPTTIGSVGPRDGWTIRDLILQVDDSVDASASYPHRWPGRWVSDGSINSGSHSFQSFKAEITCGDIGQNILVKGAGTGGADLSTTIATVSPCWGNYNTSGSSQLLQVTLTNAAGTSVTNALTYITPANIPVTQHIGNCGFAADNYDGNNADWVMTGNTSNFQPQMWNVTFAATGGSSDNHNTCAMYFGASWNPYALDAKNVWVWNPEWGIIEGTPDTNPGISGIGQDLQKWDHGWWQGSVYPWISYNDGGLNFDAIQMTAGTGPQILQVGSSVESAPTGFYAHNMELESATIAGWRMEGYAATTDQVELCDGQTGTIDTMHSRLINTGCGGTLVLNGEDNWLDGGGAPNSNIVNKGMDNIYDGSQHQGSSGMWSTAVMTQNLNRGRQAFGTLTPDFIRNGTTPYYSDHDLFIWPQDFTDIYGYLFNVAADTSSWTGNYAAIPVGGFDLMYFNNMYMLGRTSTNQIYAGSNIPAGKIMVYFSYKCPTITSFTATIRTYGGGSSTGGPAAESCSSSYQTASIAADFTSYPGQALDLNISAGEVDIAWMAIKPIGAVMMTGATIPGAPSGSYIKADGTGYGTPITGSGAGWSTTVANTLLVTDGASIAAGACGATATYGSCVAGTQLAHGGQNPNDFYLLSQSTWCGAGGSLCTYYNDAVAGHTSAQILADYTTGNSCCGVAVPSPHSLSPLVSGSTYARSFYILNFDEVINDYLASIGTSTSIANLASVASAAHADGYFVVLYTNIAGGYVQGEVTSGMQAQINAVNQAARDGRIYSDMIADASSWMADTSDQYLYGYTVHPNGLGYARLEANLETCMRNKGCVTNYTGPVATAGTSMYYGYGCTGTSTNTCTVGSSTNVPGNSNLVSGSSITTGPDPRGYTVNACGWYFSASNASPNNEYRCAVYSLNGTTATLVSNCAQTSDQTIGTVPGWSESTMPSGCTLAANTAYFIFKETNGTNGTTTNYDLNTNTNAYLSTWSYGSWSATISGMTTNTLSNSAYLKVTSN